MPITKLTPDSAYPYTQERLKALEQAVPEAFADGKINWDTLREVLGADLEDEGKGEFFGLTWPGKREARKKAAIPSRGTLVPAPGEGVNEDTTENIFIEGDNLEVLKLLQKSYAGKIKMIYIDPPYNTNEDLIYNDNFSDPIEEYLKYIEAKGDNGELLTTNTKADGRYHTKWLNMMYPRIILARELLRPDGVIFISINDIELAHLKVICEEIFGSENWVGTFIWDGQGHTDNQLEIKVTHEYILCFKKSKCEVISKVIDPNTRAESNLRKGFAENSITKNGEANPPSEVFIPEGFPCIVEKLILEKSNVDEAFFSEVNELGHISREITRKFDVSYPIRKSKMHVENYKLVEGCTVFSGWANVNKLKLFIDNDFKPLVEDDGEIEFYLSENGVIYYKKNRENAKNVTSVLRNLGTTETARAELEKQKIYFSYPKPVPLIKYLCEMGSDEGIVLDFFSGSGTFGEACFRRKNKNLKFILVQLDERIKESTLAFQYGYKFISEMAKDRLRKVITSEPANNFLCDYGFKVYRLAKSNFNIWDSKFVDGQQEFNINWGISLSEINEEHLLTELLLIEGFPLTSELKYIDDLLNNKVFKVSTQEFCAHDLFICLDETLKSDTINLLHMNKDDIFVCLDSALSDELKARVQDKFNVHVI